MSEITPFLGHDQIIIIPGLFFSWKKNTVDHLVASFSSSSWTGTELWLQFHIAWEIPYHSFITIWYGNFPSQHALTSTRREREEQ